MLHNCSILAAIIFKCFKKESQLLHTEQEFCSMFSHDGEALVQMLKDTDMKVSVFATRMGVQRGTPARWYTVARHPNEQMERAARVLGVDLADYLLRYSKKATRSSGAGSYSAALNQVNDNNPAAYGKNEAPKGSSLEACQAQVLHWQTKAYDNLEQYTKLLQLYMELVKKLPEGGQQALAQLQTLTSSVPSSR